MDDRVTDFNRMLEDLGQMIGELDNWEGHQVSSREIHDYEEQDVMLDGLADCDDFGSDDEKPLIPPRVPMEVQPSSTKVLLAANFPRKRSQSTHMWVTLPPRVCKPSGEVASEGEVSGKFVKKVEETLEEPQASGMVSIKVFNEDNSSVTFNVSPNMTAMDACHKLVILNRFKDYPNWVIVEHLTDIGMERNLEDNEIIMAVFKTWTPNSNNKFLFRKDLKKYDFFTNTANYFPTHLLNDECSDKAITEQAQQAKRILLQNLLSQCNRVPEISDILLTKDFTKKSWNKKYLILRGSGLYFSTKGKSKAFKDLQSFIQFEGSNLYFIVDAVKTHKAPTCFAFCLVPLKSQYVKEIKCFCAEDEKTFLSWTVGIRLAKLGDITFVNHAAAK